MNQFTDKQRKIFLTAGILDIVFAIVLLGVIIGRGTSGSMLPIAILLIVPGVILVGLSAKKQAKLKLSSQVTDRQNPNALQRCCRFDETVPET